MKLIHTGDIHLDSKMESNLSKEKAKERKTELLMAYKKMVEYAVENDVQAVIIAGDLFDTNQVLKNTKNVVIDSIVSNPGIDFFYVAGNHDENNFFAELEEVPENLKLFDTIWKSFEYEDVCITGVELNANNDKTIYDSLFLDRDKTNIVVLHGQESNYDARDQEEVINLSKLKNKNIDYLALGHIHSYKKEMLDGRGEYVYSGCLEGRGFDECGEKGFVVLEAKDGKITHEFVGNSIRRIYEIDVDISECATTQDIERALQEASADVAAQSLVKFVLQGRVEMDLVKDIGYLTSVFQEKFYFVKIYDRTRLIIDIARFEGDVSLKSEFIKLVYGKDMPQEDKEQIIVNGINALLGEEID